MKPIALVVLTSLLILSQPQKIVAQEACKLEGKITNSKGEAVPFAGIYAHKDGKGGMANAKGEFSLQLNCGSQEISFQSLGYQTKKIQLNIRPDQDATTIELKKVSYTLKEVNIDPSSEDPAYNIIRKATVMAEFYKKQITAYSARLYIRSFYNVKNLPWLAEKMIPDKELKDVKTGNINETILEYSYEKPNKVKERIIARKTGDQDSSRSSSNYINLNFYNIGGAEMVNPLSRAAFGVYKFEYLNSYFEGDQKIHKIEIIPKRKGNDLMEGYLHINDGSWSINAVDVQFSQIGAVIDYIQFYKKVDDFVWMPINHKIKVNFSMVGVKGKAQYLATLSDVEVKTDKNIDEKIRNNLKNFQAAIEKEKKDSLATTKAVKDQPESKTQQKIEELIQKEKLSNRETYKLVRLIRKQRKNESKDDSLRSLEVKRNYELIYEDDALTKTDSIWKQERQVPLSEEEGDIYQARDSLNKEKKGDTIYNKPRSLFGNILFFSGGLKGKNKKTTFSPKGIFAGIDGNFNTVDGFKIRKSLFTFRHENYKGKFWEIEPKVAYAFSREKFLGRFDFSSQYYKKRRAGIDFSLGRATADFNAHQPMHPTVNALASLLFTDNFPKYFQEDFVQVSHHIDLLNGLVLNTSFRYSDRKKLSNNSSYKLLDFRDREYRTNLPAHPEVVANPDLIRNHKSSKFIADLSYTPRQFYRLTSDEKQILSSKYPTFKLSYQQGLEDFLESESDFNFLSFSVHQSFSYRLINKISYHLEAGHFLNNDQLFFADFKNFSTSPFYLQTNFGSDHFSLLNYYRYNSSQEYFQAHFSLEDNHILLKYLPPFNQTSLTEEIHFNYLINDQINNYFEVGYSLNRIFLMFNLGLYGAFEGDHFQSLGFRIGLELP